MFFEYQNHIYKLMAISDIFVYLIDISTNIIKRIFMTEINKMNKI